MTTTIDMSKIQTPFKEEWLTVNGLPTYVLKIGDVQPDVPLMLILPGNPGVANFYEEFMSIVHQKSGCKIPMWCVSHAGQVKLPDELKHQAPGIYSTDIDGQLRHKARFIKDFVPPGIQIILIGHSIGAYMLLQVLKEVPSNRLLKGILLFPTIERMALSPKGSFMMPLLKYCRWLAVLATYPLYCLMSHRMQLLIAKWYFRGSNVPESSILGSLKMIDPDCVNHIFYLGKTEIAKVNEPSHDIIESHIDKLMFYYGQGDPWCPVQYYQDMKKVYPNADIRLCTRKMDHAFVLEYSIPMAEVFWDWINEKIPTLIPGNNTVYVDIKEA